FCAVAAWGAALSSSCCFHARSRAPAFLSPIPQALHRPIPWIHASIEGASILPFLNADLLGGELGDTPGTTLRILVVDDEPRLRRSLTLLLEGTDREIDECATGSEAIAALARRQYDLVLLDLRLPDVTGLEVMDWLAKRLPAMTVIVVSADDVIDSAIGALRRGAYDFVRKPYQPEELLRTVDNALQRKRLERTNALISARLERSERLHRYLVDHSPDIIYTVDEEGRFTYLNPTVATALGN